MKVGRKPCPIREAWMLRFGLTYARPTREMAVQVLQQLSFCRSDEARRLLLGISS